MRTNSRETAVSITLSLILVFGGSTQLGLHPNATAQNNAPQPTPLKVNTRNIGGAFELTGDTLLYGDVKVYLPDDMRAGDTISGTVVAEPKGNTPEERERNLAELKGVVFEIKDFGSGVENQTTVGPSSSVISKIQVGTDQPFTFKIPSSSTSGSTGSLPGLGITLTNTSGTVKGDSFLSYFQSVRGIQPSSPTTANDFRLPSLGQQGRPIEVFGPFDGNAMNTSLNWSAVRSTGQDFEKNTEPVAGGFGLIGRNGEFGFVAESPRKAVFRSPSNAVGPVETTLKEGNLETKGTVRIVGVRLSAPKTNLSKGERTIVTTLVTGLAGITSPVPLQLDARGVISMDGGNFQNLTIPPGAVSAEGKYSTTRNITGLQAGGFSVTATVIVRPFDLCLRDDTSFETRLLWNSFTGDYVFTIKPFTLPATQGAITPAAQTGSSTLTGTGKPTMKGCIITLSHNAPDRRIFARLDTCTNTGNAEVQTNSPKTNSKITDTNTTDNSCPSPPPK